MGKKSVSLGSQSDQKGKPARKLTTRTLITTHQDAQWERCRLANFTTEDLRHSLSKNLIGAILGENSKDDGARLMAEEDRTWFLEVLDSVPANPRFWDILSWAEREEQTHPKDPTYDAALLIEKIFHNDITREHGDPLPREWISAAWSVLDVHNHIRNTARAGLQVMSYILRRRWERGQEAGLLGAISGGMITEEWVTDTIAKLQRQQHTAATDQERTQAKLLLKKVGKALIAEGSGRTKVLTPAVCSQIHDTYQQNYDFCRRFKKEVQKTEKWPQKKRDDHLESLFSMAIDDVEKTIQEANLLKPSEWARQRTAKKMGFSEEAIRRERLSGDPSAH